MPVDAMEELKLQASLLEIGAVRSICVKAMELVCRACGPVIWGATDCRSPVLCLSSCRDALHLDAWMTCICYGWVFQAL